MSDEPRRFHLQRDIDATGASGTGHVADGVLWPDGTATVHWRGQDNSDAFWPTGMDGIRRRSCHDGLTRIVWDDPEPAPRGDCPHCPDGHTPADSGSQPWHVRVGPERDSDGQPIRLYLERAGGAHVAEPDAEWVQGRLNRTQA
jgi:hypothetical protein